MHSSGTLLSIIALIFLGFLVYAMISHGVGIPPLSFLTTLGGIIFAILFVFFLFALVRSLVKNRR